MKPDRAISTARSERFAALDLLRGVAALSVFVFHMPFPGGETPLPRGYLAVDLFFALSGFVIAHAYSRRLGTAGGFRDFLLARLIRLYPVYAIGTLMGAAFLVVYAVLGRGDAFPDLTVGTWTATLATAILFLPTPNGWSVSPMILFPLVLPAWSLFWELWMNVIHGLTSSILRPRVLALFIALGGAGIVFSQHKFGIRSTDGGLFGDIFAGISRALFSYFIGVALFEIRKRFRAPAVPGAALAAVLLVAVTSGHLGGWAYDFACMAVLFPLLVWFGADATTSAPVRRAGIFLGLLSYPLYILQAPLFLWLAPLAVRLERMAPTGGFAHPAIDFVVIIFISWVVARWVDAPVRDWLRRRIVPLSPVPRAETAP